MVFVHKRVFYKKESKSYGQIIFYIGANKPERGGGRRSNAHGGCLTFVHGQRVDCPVHTFCSRSGPLVDHAPVDLGDVRRDHLVDEVLEQRRGLPTELGLGLGRVADEDIHLGRAEVLGIHSN